MASQSTPLTLAPSRAYLDAARLRSTFIETPQRALRAVPGGRAATARLTLKIKYAPISNCGKQRNHFPAGPVGDVLFARYRVRMADFAQRQGVETYETRGPAESWVEADVDDLVAFMESLLPPPGSDEEWETHLMAKSQRQFTLRVDYDRPVIKRDGATPVRQPHTSFTVGNCMGWFAEVKIPGRVPGRAIGHLLLPDGSGWFWTTKPVTGPDAGGAR